VLLRVVKSQDIVHLVLVEVVDREANVHLVLLEHVHFAQYFLPFFLVQVASIDDQVVVQLLDGQVEHFVGFYGSFEAYFLI